MLKGTLTFAIDGKGIGPKTHEIYSTYDREREVWYLYKEGPSYSNRYQITEYDEKGLAFLRRVQSKHIDLRSDKS